MPTRSDIFRSSRTDKKGRPMNPVVGRIFVSNNSIYYYISYYLLILLSLCV